MDEAGRIWETVRQVRERSPLVQNITNYVSMDIAANALLALGASPAMVHAEEEVEDFVTIASALVVNIGTLSPPWVAGMIAAADRAVALGRPWVLDPVGAGATPYRTGVARDLSHRSPTVIRGNASEILALAGESAATKGVDSVHESGSARGVARALAGELGCVVAVTGAVDYITDGTRMMSVANGHPMMTKVTALGCSASALTGACLAVESDALRAATHALAILGVCGERAAVTATGPASLRTQLIDGLYTLDQAALTAARVREESVA